jgi:hypothetical protein
MIGGHEFLVPASTRLHIWTVTVQWVEPDSQPRLTLRVPAYTDTEAACVAARMSGIPRQDWCRYYFIPTTRGDVSESHILTDDGPRPTVVPPTHEATP